VSSGIIHIYGQHEYQDLLHPAQQTAILEELAGLSRGAVEQAYKRYEEAHKALRDLEDRIGQYRAEREDLLFTLGELSALPITEGLEEELQSGLDLARSAQELKRCAHMAEDILYSGASSVVELMARVREHVARMASIDRQAEPLVGALGDIAAQIEDVSLTLREKMSSYDYDPEGIEALEEKLYLLQDLKRKHRTDEAGLLALRRRSRKGSPSRRIPAISSARQERPSRRPHRPTGPPSGLSREAKILYRDLL
jgi:DNA repair protein RecN (Recombination protein N)